MTSYRIGLTIGTGFLVLLAGSSFINCWADGGKPSPPLVGAYYFDGWAGHSPQAKDPRQAWARRAPTHLSRRLLDEFPQREPIWGWRDDSLEIMERQIDLAGDHGLSFFAFCWYWHDNGKAINTKAIADDPKHTGLELYLKARNRQRLHFCLLVANHQGFDIKGPDAWKQAADFWMPYLKHPQHLKVGGKPLLLIFNPAGGNREGFAYLQRAAHQAGFPGVAIAGCGGGSRDLGYTHRTHYNTVPGYAGGSAERKYAELVRYNQRAWQGSREQPYIPVLTAGWDKRPWEGPSGLNQPPGWYFPDRTPDQVAQFLRAALAWMERNPDQTTAERMVLIYAWNEFGEGGYLAPTRGDPEGGFLKAIKAVVSQAKRANPKMGPARSPHRRA
jgi:hypothetical protein